MTRSQIQSMQVRLEIAAAAGGHSMPPSRHDRGSSADVCLLSVLPRDMMITRDRRNGSQTGVCQGA